MKRISLLLITVLISLSSVVAKSYYVTTANLNMRSLPCTCSKIVKTIPKGAQIQVLNYEDDEWARVCYNGQVNYVSRKYIALRSYQANNKARTVSYYTNVEGYKVQSPTCYKTAPVGATALCRDGTYSFSRNRRGTCSHHGGVRRWL